MNGRNEMKLEYPNHRMKKLLRVCLLCLVAAILLAVPALAANEYAEKGAQWVLDGIYWVALAVIALKLLGFVSAKNTTGALVMLLLGAICVVLIAQPEMMKTLGEKLMGIVGLTS